MLYTIQDQCTINLNDLAYVGRVKLIRPNYVAQNWLYSFDVRIGAHGLDSAVFSNEKESEKARNELIAAWEAYCSSKKKQ